MTHKKSLRAALIASVCLLPFQALADDSSFDIGAAPAPQATVAPTSNSVTVGAQYNSGPSDYLGRFNGLATSGVTAVGAGHYGYRSPWDSQGTDYFDIRAANLGLDNRSVDMKLGQQGTWGLNFSYEGIPYYASDTFQTAYQSNGRPIPGIAPGSLTWGFAQILPASGKLPAVWQPEYSAAQVPNLAEESIHMQRDIFTGGGHVQVNEWLISVNVRHEHKEGTQVNSLEFGGVGVSTISSAKAPSTAVTGVVYFPQPINFDTDSYNVTAAYSRDKMQFQIGYTFNQFTDNVSGFTVQNPFNFVGATAFLGAPNSSLTAVYPLAPSNTSHQIKAMFGYNITPTTRFNANFADDIQLQNASFEQGSGDPNLPQTLPTNNLGGVIQNFFGNAALTTRPMTNLDLRIAYSIDDRVNSTPVNVYDTIYTRSNDADQGPKQSVPFSYDKQTGVVEANYRIAPETKLTVSDTLDRTFRSDSNASMVTSNRIAAKIRSGFWDDNVFGTLSVAHENRTARNYDTNGWWNAQGCGVGGVGVNGDCGPEAPGTVIYMEASRIHDEIKATIDASPLPGLGLSAMVKYANDYYPDTQYGLTNNHNLSIEPDVDWQVTPALDAHAYYNYQQIYNDQASIYASGNAATTGFNVPWQAKTTDNTQTAGVDVDWAAIPDKLKLSADYHLSYGDTAYALGDGGALIGTGITSQLTLANLAMQSMPNVTSMLSTIDVSGEYTISPQATLIVGYSFERFTYSDWIQNAGATQYADLLMPGTLVPNSTMHMVNAAVRYKF